MVSPSLHRVFTRGFFSLGISTLCLAQSYSYFYHSEYHVISKAYFDLRQARFCTLQKQAVSLQNLYISLQKRPTYVIMIDASLQPLDCSLSIIRGVSILLFYPQVLLTWDPEHCRHSMNIYQMMTEYGGQERDK